MSRIEITLKSDLCAASGDGYSSVIDTDVSYDKNGFPIIGGRRLKGCLRNAAELIGSEKINEIFGQSGSSFPGSLRISDAVINDYYELVSEAENGGYEAEKIISLFSYTRASTAIKNDTAEENSLRFTRVVKHYSPFDNHELKFTADVEIDDEYAEEFSDICRALRNIGYKRNRGFGAVECRFIEEKIKTEPNTFDGISGDESVYTYTIRLKENMMISGKVSDETLDYIPGTSVLGMVAANYKSKYGKDTDFDEIFLKENVRFSNLYISDKDGKEYFPAPVILGKIKGEKNVFNIITHDSGDQIVKPVKGGYCDFSSNIIKPMTETVYHHSTLDDKTLYTQTSICKDQYFRGTISGRTEYVKKIAELFESISLRLGRSKTAQYSDCELVKSKLESKQDTMITIDEGKEFIVLLLSDVLISDEFGGYDISAEGLKKAVGMEEYEFDNGMERKRSALRYRVLSGYNTKWNIQKPHIRTIGAGSTLVFKSEKKESFPERSVIGAKKNEGFGQILYCCADAFAEISGKDYKDKAVIKSNGILDILISADEKNEKMRMEAIECADELSKYMNQEANSSQIGRIMLFVKKQKSFEDMERFITELKSKFKQAEKKETVFLKCISKIIEESRVKERYADDLWKDYLTLILTLIKYKNRGIKK